MTDSLIITRYQLNPGAPEPLDPLELQDLAAGYRVFGTVVFTPQPTETTNPTSTPYVNGDRPMHIRRANGQYTIKVMVYANTANGLQQRLDRLERAFCDQFDFTASHVLDGFIREYVCHAGSMAYDTDGGGIDEVWHRDFAQPVVFTGQYSRRLPTP